MTVKPLGGCDVAITGSTREMIPELCHDALQQSWMYSVFYQGVAGIRGIGIRFFFSSDLDPLGHTMSFKGKENIDNVEENKSLQEE